MLPNTAPLSDTNNNNDLAQQGAEAASPPSIKQLIDFEALSQLMQATAKLAANLNQRLQGGAKGGFYLDGGRISNTNLKQQMEEVCALKKKIEDLEPVMKKAVIMAEPEPAQEAPVSKRAARGKGGKAVTAASAVTDDHDKRISDLENMIKSQSERMKKTEDENKKLGALVAQLETKAGKQNGGSQLTQAQIQTLNNSKKFQEEHSKQVDQLKNRVAYISQVQSQAGDSHKRLQDEHTEQMDQLEDRITSLETSPSISASARFDSLQNTLDRVSATMTDISANVKEIEDELFFCAAMIYELQKEAGVGLLFFKAKERQEKLEANLQKHNIAKLWRKC